MEHKNTILSWLIVAVFVAGAGYYVYTLFPSDSSDSDDSEQQVAPQAQEQESADMKKRETEAKTPADGDAGGKINITLDGVEAGDGPAIEIERVSPEDVSASAVTSMPAPDLTREIKLYNNETFPEKQKTEIFERIKELTGILGENNGYFEGWHELGVLRKAIGDYEGARDAWEYAAALRPRSSMPLASLAHLYTYYFRDYARAEANYLHAIEEEPTAAFLYGQAAEFYLDVMGDKEKAIGILEQGAEALPNNTLIPQAIEELKRLR